MMPGIAFQSNPGPIVSPGKSFITGLILSKL